MPNILADARFMIPIRLLLLNGTLVCWRRNIEILQQWARLVYNGEGD